MRGTSRCERVEAAPNGGEGAARTLGRDEPSMAARERMLRAFGVYMLTLVWVIEKTGSLFGAWSRWCRAAVVFGLVWLPILFCRSYNVELFD